MSWKCCIFSFWRFFMHAKYHSPISPQSSSIEVYLNEDSFRSISGGFFEWMSTQSASVIFCGWPYCCEDFQSENYSLSIGAAQNLTHIFQESGHFLFFFFKLLLLFPSPWILKISVHCSAMSQRLTLWPFQCSFEPHTLSIIKQSSLSKKLSPSTDDWNRT